MNNSNIQFLLGDRLITLNDVSPTTTLLNFLREDANLKGTKEGCAEGDCGACTVVIGELVNDSLSYRAVNACILFVPMLDGKQVLTVEHLKNRDGALHPVQQAMVDCHASQCGFCTPGIVMSGFALYQNTRMAKSSSSSQTCSDSDDQADCLNKTYAGNLCRCTGYGPIIESGKTLIKHALENQTDIEQESSTIIEKLKQIAPSSLKQLSTPSQLYIQPNTVTELSTTLNQRPQAHLLAGATDLGLWVTKQRKHLETLIYLGQIPELKKIDVTEHYIELGASVTYSEALPVLSEYYPQFENYLERHSSTQIRNSGTIIGNIANGSPIGDMPPPLIALGASVYLTSVDGTRTLPLEDYFIEYGKQDRQPNEFIEKIRIPLNVSGSFNLYKISKRFEQDISTVSAAFYVEVENDTVANARICFGGMAGTPMRAAKTESCLANAGWNRSTIERACSELENDFQPLDDFRGSSRYRMTVAQNLLRKFFIQTLTAESMPKVAVQILHTGEIKHA